MVGWNLWSYDLGRNVDPSPTTSRQFYIRIGDLDTDSLVVNPIWGQPGLVIEYRLTEEPKGVQMVSYSKVVYKDRYPGYIENLRLLEIVVPTIDTEMPRFDEALNLFVRELQRINPGREVYVVYLKKGTGEMEYDFVPASDYSYELNDCVSREHSYYEGGL